MERFWKLAAATGRLILMATLVGAAVAYAQNDAPAQESAPDVPDAIQFPPGEEVGYSLAPRDHKFILARRVLTESSVGR